MCVCVYFGIYMRDVCELIARRSAAWNRTFAHIEKCVSRSIAAPCYVNFSDVRFIVLLNAATFFEIDRIKSCTSCFFFCSRPHDTRRQCREVKRCFHWKHQPVNTLHWRFVDSRVDVRCMEQLIRNSAPLTYAFFCTFPLCSLTSF